MKDHKGMIRGFFNYNESWYALADRRDNVLDELMIGMYGANADAGTSGEFAIRWTELSGKRVPQLQAYDDSWHALSQFTDLLAALAEKDGENPTPEQLIELLKSLGIRELTQREPPHRRKVQCDPGK